jgi:acyl-CoA synthetase (AMP-forming)/AMP-acid ligase II
MNFHEVIRSRSRPHLEARRAFEAEWRAAKLIADHSIRDELDAAASEAPQAGYTFLHEDGSTTLGYAELAEAAPRVAASLAARGLRAGDRIVLQLPHCREGTLLFFAAMHLGLVVVPVVSIYGPNELGFILRSAGARALAVPSRWRDIDFDARVRALEDVSDLGLVIVTDGGRAGDRSVCWRDLLAGEAAAVAPHRSEASDICVINYTSGTTGTPKGVMHSHRSLIAEARSFWPQMAPGTQQVYFNPLPAGHTSGLLSLLRPLANRFSSVMADNWRPAEIEELLTSRSIGVMTASPFHLGRLLESDVLRRAAQDTLVLAGGANCPPSLFERAAAAGVRAGRSYGSTEHPTISTGIMADSDRDLAHTDGRLNPGTRVRIVDGDGRDVAPGEDGEILSMGPELFEGYLDEGLNRDVFDAEGWFRTGDIGRLDGNGHLTITDRKKDLIIRGGENIASKEVEDIAMRHPQIIEAAAVGWPDDAYGERVGLFLRVAPGGQVAFEEVATLFRSANVARQKTPERIVVLAEFPRDATGKILKRELRNRAAALSAGSMGVEILHGGR